MPAQKGASHADARVTREGHTGSTVSGRRPRNKGASHADARVTREGHTGSTVSGQCPRKRRPDMSSYNININTLPQAADLLATLESSGASPTALQAGQQALALTTTNSFNNSLT